jgi:hypothetical protein
VLLEVSFETSVNLTVGTEYTVTCTIGQDACPELKFTAAQPPVNASTNATVSTFKLGLF